MGNQYQLVGVADPELLTGLSGAVRRGNEATAEVLAHLVEIEERMLHLDLGFPSLFAYCVTAQSMSEGAAGRRVAAARVARRFPEVFALVARGNLHLSAVCGLAPHLDSANARELFAACAGKSRRQVDELLAAQFPKPDVREQIRLLPSGTQSAPPQSAPPQSAPPQSAGTRARTRVWEIEPLSADRYGVRFTAGSELRALIERARAIASHRVPDGDLASLIKLALTQFVQREEGRRFAVGRKPRKVATPPGGVACVAATTPTRIAKRSRHIAATVRREVYARDGGVCSFVADDGRRCEARAFVEIDHIDPFAVGGASSTDNLRLRCRAHNQQHARRYFGSGYVRAAIATARRDGAPPK